MSLNQPFGSDPAAAKIEQEAALWLVRRDRGLTPEEQDAYSEWLTADRRHAEALTRHAAVLQRLMQVYEWQPGQSANANPDLFAPAKATLWGRWALGLAAAFLLLATLAVWHNRLSSTHAVQARSYLRVNERQILPDGSVVELRTGSRISVEFSLTERRVRLTGEAHFQVEKATQPFVVLAGGVVLRAVGTAFNVRLDSDSVELLVTEGQVAVARLDSGAAAKTNDNIVNSTTSWREVSAGQRSIVSLAGVEKLQVESVSSADARKLLQWQVPRLQFSETPLAIAVEEFNRLNDTRLVLADRDLAKVPVGGTFRADNPDGFVRVLELTLEVKAERRADGRILLSR